VPLLLRLPHVEGGRNPIRRFEESMAGLDERAKQRFYCENFVDLRGAGRCCSSYA